MKDLVALIAVCAVVITSLLGYDRYEQHQKQVRAERPEPTAAEMEVIYQRAACLREQRAMPAVAIEDAVGKCFGDLKP